MSVKFLVMLKYSLFFKLVDYLTKELTQPTNQLSKAAVKYSRIQIVDYFHTHLPTYVPTYLPTYLPTEITNCLSKPPHMWAN